MDWTKPIVIGDPPSAWIYNEKNGAKARLGKKRMKRVQVKTPTFPFKISKRDWSFVSFMDST
jgi:hypothetical protein